MTETLEFLQRHGYWLVFVWIFIDQLGVPIPAVPLLIGAGALAGAGKVDLATTITVAVIACCLPTWCGFQPGGGAAITY